MAYAAMGVVLTGALTARAADTAAGGLLRGVGVCEGCCLDVEVLGLEALAQE